MWTHGGSDAVHDGFDVGRGRGGGVGVGADTLEVGTAAGGDRRWLLAECFAVRDDDGVNILHGSSLSLALAIAVGGSWLARNVRQRPRAVGVDGDLLGRSRRLEHNLLDVSVQSKVSMGEMVVTCTRFRMN